MWRELDARVPSDHLARQIQRLVSEDLDLEKLYCSYCGRGTPAHNPKRLLMLLLYCHHRGRTQPKQWHEDLQENTPAQWLTFGMHVSLTSLYEFRDRVQPLLAEFNQEVIRTAIAEKHTTGSCGAVDGTTVAAHASRHKVITLETTVRRLESLDEDLAELKVADERAPVIENPLPEESPSSPMASTPEESRGKKSAWKAKTVRGKKRQRSQYRRARAVLDEKHKANAQRRKDKRKKSAAIQVGLGDPMAPLGFDKNKTFRPLYNVQVMSGVDTDLVLAYAVTRTTADSGQLVPMIDLTANMTNRPLEEVLADSGYPTGEELAQCKARNVVVYAPWNENSFTKIKRAKAKEKEQTPKEEFRYDPSLPGYWCPKDKPLRFRERTKKQKANGDYDAIEIYQTDPSDCASCPLKDQCVRGRSGARTVRRREHEELVEELKARMKTPEAKEKYGKRCCTVERRFADFKTNRGLTQFSGQTPERADAQLGLCVLAHNLLTLDKLRKRNTRPQENAEKTAG